MSDSGDDGVRGQKLLGQVIKCHQRLHAVLVHPQGADSIGCLATRNIKFTYIAVMESVMKMV